MASERPCRALEPTFSALRREAWPSNMSPTSCCLRSSIWYMLSSAFSVAERKKREGGGGSKGGERERARGGGGGGGKGILSAGGRGGGRGQGGDALFGFHISAEKKLETRRGPATKKSQSFLYRNVCEGGNREYKNGTIG